MASIVALILLFILFPYGYVCRPEAAQYAKSSDLKQMNIALHDYAKDHDGYFPESLDALVVVAPVFIKNLKDKALLRDDGDIQYFRPSLRMQDVQPNHVILLWVSSLGTSVCFADGNCKTLFSKSSGWLRGQ